MRLFLALIGLAISFALPTFAQQKGAVDPQTLQQFDAGAKKYDDAVNNNDAAAVAAFFTEDAIFVTHTGPLYGRQAIKNQFAELYKRWHHSNHTTKIDPNSLRIVGTADNIAYNGEWSETNQAENGKPFQLKGYFSCIAVREGDAWKIWILTSNITPVPAATPSPTTTPSNQ